MKKFLEDKLKEVDEKNNEIKIIINKTSFNNEKKFENLRTDLEQLRIKEEEFKNKTEYKINEINKNIKALLNQLNSNNNAKQGSILSNNNDTKIKIKENINKIIKEFQENSLRSFEKVLRENSKNKEGKEKVDKIIIKENDLNIIIISKKKFRKKKLNQRILMII